MPSQRRWLSRLAIGVRDTTPLRRVRASRLQDFHSRVVFESDVAMRIFVRSAGISIHRAR
jgi:hypothetical protein